MANTTNYSDTSFKIGDSPYYGDTDAYISNFRLVKGSAVYGGNFTPSTAPLTAISGTALLTLQSPEPFTDNSGNSLAITQAGNVKAQNFGPFTADEAGAGGLVWLKGRNVADQHFQFDTERGTGPYLVSNSTAAEVTDAGFHISSYNANGFSLQGNGTGTNNTSYDYTSWTFRKAEKFFDVVTYTGNGSNRTINHSLGSVPAVMIVKCYSGRTDSWIVYHSSRGANEYAKLDTTNSFYTGAAAATTWNQTAPTDSVFTVGTDGGVNQNGVSYVAYLFASDAGGFGDDGSESIIKCGSFTTNGSGNAVISNLGFEPSWLMIKKSSGSSNWEIRDDMRGFGVGASVDLKANESDAESSPEANKVFATATGFEANVSSSSDYIYMAIRRPMKTPESGTEVFATAQRDTTAPIFEGGFPVDAAIIADVSGAWSNSPSMGSRLTGTGRLATSNSNAEGADGLFMWDYMNGWGDGSGSYPEYYSWMFKRATGFMDAVCYTGDGTSSRNINHNLGAVPELMIRKTRNNADNWQVYSADLTNEYSIILNTSAAAVGPGYSAYYPTEPTDTVFTVGSAWNTNSYNMITYLFASLAGVSKVGSYTGTGNSLDIDCGFSNGARFVMIKRTDSSSDWWVWDTTRGIVSGNDPTLRLNSSAAETTTSDYIDPLSSGFTLTTAGNWLYGMNYPSGNYIFLAIA